MVLLFAFLLAFAQWTIPALIGGAVLHTHGDVAGFIAGGAAFFVLEMLIAMLQAEND